MACPSIRLTGAKAQTYIALFRSMGLISDNMLNKQRGDKTVLFYGPLGHSGATPRVGGGETGNRKTVGYLGSLGFEVLAVSKPYPRDKGILRGGVYAASLVGILISISWKLITTPSIKHVHISGFYMHLIYHEWALILVSKLLQRRVVYELRGSGVQRGYDKRSWIYRACFAQAIGMADAILCQGSRYLPFLRTLAHTPTIHYPNCNNLFTWARVPLPRDLSATDLIQLVYFGRIVISKRPEICIKVCHALRSQGINARLQIVGSGHGEYLAGLSELARSLDIQDYVSFVPPLKLPELIKILAASHFFIFPSMEEREGQSNALTESMALGVVPVASSAGFNAEVVGDESLIVGIEDNEARYADVVLGVIKAKKWKTLSKAVRDRINSTYSEEVALRALKSAYMQ